MIEGGFEPPPPERLEPYSSALDQLGHPINGKEKSVLHIITFYSLKHHKYILNFNTEKVQHKKIKQ